MRKVIRSSAAGSCCGNGVRVDIIGSDCEKMAISRKMSQNKERQLTIYPDALAENNITFATNISDFAMKTMDCVASEKELLKRIETIKKILAKRAKDPTSFWETFAGAFADIFHT